MDPGTLHSRVVAHWVPASAAQARLFQLVPPQASCRQAIDILGSPLDLAGDGGLQPAAGICPKAPGQDSRLQGESPAMRGAMARGWLWREPVVALSLQLWTLIKSELTDTMSPVRC